MGIDRLRSLAKWAVAGAAKLAGISEGEEAARCGRGDVLILCYHSVVDAGGDDPAGVETGLALPRETFGRQVEFIADRYEVVGLEEAALGRTRPSSGRPLCAITFDDGWADVAEHAWPVLAKHGLPATTFLPAGHVGARTPLVSRVLLDLLDMQAAKQGHGIEWVQHAQRRIKQGGTRGIEVNIGRLRSLLGDPTLPSRPLLTWEQVSAGRAAGITFGSHSVSHRMLTELADHELEAELSESKSEIERRTGRPVRSFCYPYGDWDERVRRAVAEGGYEVGCTTEAGWAPLGADRLVLPRCEVTEASSADPWGRFSVTVFQAFLAGTVGRAKRLLPGVPRGRPRTERDRAEADACGALAPSAGSAQSDGARQ